MTLRLAPIIGELPKVWQVDHSKFPPDNPNNPKGQNTWNWLYPPNPTAGRTMIARRFSGDEVGKHFHPRVANKDPERFLLIVGKVTFWFRDLFGNNREINLDADTFGPIELVIPPYLLHGVIVQSDTTWFLEQQSEAFDPAVNYSAE